MTSTQHPQTGYADVNGLRLYYELHGQGQPLVVVPGGFMTIAAMGELVPRLAMTRQVIGVEVQGHGHTADIDRPLTFAAMADDIAALLGHLGLPSADVLGHSLGGGVALQTAIRHPAAVRRLVLLSAPCKRDGWRPEVLAAMAANSVEGFAGTPIETSYRSTSPRPEAWPEVLTKVVALLATDYDWSADVAALATPTLLVLGDADSISLAHAVEFFALLGGDRADGDLQGLRASRLAVLPATTHVGWALPQHGMLTRTDLLLPMLTEFLDEPAPYTGS